MKKKKTISDYSIPDLCLNIIFNFLDNDTLWCSIPLVCKHFNNLLYSDVKNGLIKRDCYGCTYYIDKLKAYKNKKWALSLGLGFGVWFWY